MAAMMKTERSPAKSPAQVPHRLTRIAISDITEDGRIALVLPDGARPRAVLSTNLLPAGASAGAEYSVVVFAGSIHPDMLDDIIRAITATGGTE